MNLYASLAKLCVLKGHFKSIQMGMRSIIFPEVQYLCVRTYTFLYPTYCPASLVWGWLICLQTCQSFADLQTDGFFVCLFCFFLTTSKHLQFCIKAL